MSESALGKAIVVTDAIDKEFSCPICGDSFSTRTGTSMHSQKIHGEPLYHYRELADKDFLYSLYWGEFKTCGEIAEVIGCGEKTVHSALRDHGIPSRTAGNTPSVIDSGLSTFIVEILEGELLGDGSMRDRGWITSPFRLGTSSKEYRDWLADLLRNVGFNLRTPNVSHELEGYGEYQSYRVETWQYPCLYRLYRHWYPDGEKRVPDDLTITPLNLRHWYIGDGSYGESLNLHTEGFTNECRNRLIQQLAVNGIRATAQSSGELHIWRKSHDRFFNFMARLPPSLHSAYGYKWPDEHL